MTEHPSWYERLSQLTGPTTCSGTAGNTHRQPPCAPLCDTEGGTGAQARRSDRIERSIDGIALDRSIGLHVLLDLLVVTGVRFDVERSVTSWRVTFDPPLTPALRALVEPWRGWLLVTAVGRRTGHAPAVCDTCGEVSMLSIVNSSGTTRGLASTPWPRCLITPRCTGRRIVRRADVEDVRRVRHKPAPRQPAARRTLWTARVFDIDESLDGGDDAA